MRVVHFGLVGLVTALSSAAVFACTGEDPVLASTERTGGKSNADAASAPPPASPTSADDAGADADAADPDPPSEQRKCVLACEADAGDSALTFYRTVQECTCAADGGACEAVCPTYCQSPSPDSNACNDCVARAYVGPCSVAVSCGGDEACVAFADCVRACVDGS
jgi:hypothetical protein